MNNYITRGVVKVIEVIGVSEQSFDDAVTQAVSKAAESLEGITGVEVQNMTARVRDGRISQYHVTVKLAFGVR